MKQFIDPFTVTGWPKNIRRIAELGHVIDGSDRKDLDLAADVMKQLIELGMHATNADQRVPGHNPPRDADDSVGEILQAAQDAVLSRAVERDRGAGERSMEACVVAFNALFGLSLTVEQGWLFMVVLKLARTPGGDMKLDDYIDGAAYFALGGETAAKERGRR